MKCFSFIFVFIFLFNVQAADFLLKATSQEKVSIGDIVRLKVETEKLEDLKRLDEYKNRRISPLLYVLDVSNDKENFFLDCIISEKEKNEKVEVKDNFKIRDIVFEYKKVDLKNTKFDFLLDPTKVFKNKFIKITVSLLAFILLLILFFFLKEKMKSKKVLKVKREKLKKIINEEFSRSTVEKIYELRSSIKAYLGIIPSLDELTDKLKEIQYKKNWTEQEEEIVKKRFEVFKKDILK